MNITVYSKPDCVQCVYTKIRLEQMGLAYQDIDVTRDSDAAKDAVRIGIRLGNNTLPVVVVADHGETECWSGFKIDRLQALGEVA